MNAPFKTTLLASTPLEMKQVDWFPLLGEIYKWWLEFPDRPGFQDIDPLRFPSRLLKDIVVLELTAENSFCVRLAGTHVCELYGREIKGETLNDTCRRASRKEFENPYRQAMTENGAVLYHREMSQQNGLVENYVLLVVPIGSRQAPPAGVMLASWDLPNDHKRYFNI